MQGAILPIRWTAMPMTRRFRLHLIRDNGCTSSCSNTFTIGEADISTGEFLMQLPYGATPGRYFVLAVWTSISGIVATAPDRGTLAYGARNFTILQNSCTSHDNCSSSAYCDSSRACYPCVECLVSLDGIDNRCPAK